MSGYFVHGGTQYPYGQGSTQQSSNASNSTSNQNSFFGNRQQAYPPTQNHDSFSQSNQPYSFNNQGPNNSMSSSTAGFSSQSSPFASSIGQSNSGFGNTVDRQPMNSSYSSNQGFGSPPNMNVQNSGGYNSSSSFGQSKPSGNSNGYNFSSKSIGQGSSHQTGSYNSYPPTQSSYEKALYNAANQYYSNKGRGGGGGRGGRGSFSGGRGRGGRGSFGGGGSSGGSKAQVSSGPKPIKATEIKAYLYAWCGQRKLKPEYEVAPKGQQPNVTFTCKLIITGLDYIADVEAANKRDAQSKAAWEFCENLVKLNYMKASELPVKPADPAPKSQSVGASGEATSSEAPEEVEKYGGWILTNCRQRLNQFCQREHVSPDFKHQTLGPEHARLFICDLQIPVKSLQKEFKASERGSTKKQATAVCALAMVRQLYTANLIEKFGAPIKHVSRGTLLGGKQPAPLPVPAVTTATGSASPVTAGQKRKAEDKDSAPESVDENGNWTIDNCRQRLNQYCQVNNIPCDVIYAEEGAPGSRTYTASLNLMVKPDETEKELKAVSTANSKKAAAQGCALQLLSQLYKLTLVEANTVSAAAKKKQAKAKPLMETNMPAPYPNYGFPSFGGNHFAVGPQMFGQQAVRRTPVQDIYLNEKHKSIYPLERDLDAVQRTVRAIEVALKEVSDELTDSSSIVAGMVIKEEKEEGAEVKRKLQGVMRVGALAKGLLLKGETNVNLVLLCQEAPTAKLLIQIAQVLPKHIKGQDGDKFNVETAMPDAAITVQNTVIKTEEHPQIVVTVTINLTSPVVRIQSTEDTNKDPPGSLNKEKCLQALAELRHAKWFQACANAIPSCVIVIRILLDLKRRLPQWSPISAWAIELLVEKALHTSPVPISLGTSFLRVLECLSSGVLLTEQGIADPCERTEVDVTGNMTKQEREFVTKSAQDAMRLVVFRQIHKVLEMEPLQKPDWWVKKTKVEGANP